MVTNVHDQAAPAYFAWSVFLVLAAILLPGCKTHPQAEVPRTRPTPRVLRMTPSPVPTAALPTPALAIPENLQSWTIQRRFVLAAKGRGADRSVTISSDGRVVWEESSSGSSLNYKGTHSRSEARISKASIAKLRKALQDPDLAKQTAGTDSGKWLLTVTLNGNSGTFYSENRAFSGSAGRLAEVFTSVTPKMPSPTSAP